MTVGEYITEKLSNMAVNISEGMINTELIRVGLIPSEEITGEIDTDLFFYNIIPDILLLPNSVSEGGYSISYDKDTLMKYYSVVAKRIGKSDVFAPTITDRSNIW